MEIIRLPKLSYVFGDVRPGTVSTIPAHPRPLYGPANEKGERQLIGLIAASEVERLVSMFEFADANLTSSDHV